MKNPIATRWRIAEHLRRHDSGSQHVFVEPKIVQIGFNKTGTTFMEKRLYPLFEGVSIVQGAYFEDFKIFSDYVVYARDECFDVDTARKLYAIAVSRSPCGKVDVYMDESLTFRYYNYFDQNRVVRRVAKIFDTAKIVLGTREQTSWLVSHWGQFLRSGGVLNLPEFAELMINRQNSDLYMTHFGYIAKCLHEVLPEDRIFIYDVGQLRDSARLLLKLEEILGRKAQNVQRLDPVNEASTPFELVFMRNANRILRFDCGANPYALDENEMPSTWLQRMSKKIKYKYKYCRIALPNIIKNINIFDIPRCQRSKRRVFNTNLKNQIIF